MKNDIGSHPVWAEIDIQAIEYNLQIVRQLIQPAVEIMAVVKADGYGHGAETVAHAVCNAGVDALGVARLSEAVSLRKAGVTLPIMIFGYTPPECTEVLINYSLTQTLFSLPYAEAINCYAKKAGGCISAHLKIDTGMGRLGLIPNYQGNTRNNSYKIEEKFLDTIKNICNLENLSIKGIFTHFAASDTTDKTSAKKQLAIFNTVVHELEMANIKIPCKHAANSGAIIGFPDAHLDMVRPGIMMYGLYPSEEMESPELQLKPAMQLKAKVVQTKQVPSDFSISYGHTFTTAKPTTIATLPLGYADGYDRRLSSLGKVLIRGQYAPVVGRICMDQLVIDIGHIQGVSEGDEAVIWGKQNNKVITVDSIANQLGTINYEVVSTIMTRVPKIYV